MGCISSKIVTKSRSFRDEFSQSLQRRINGLPMLDDLLISKDGGDEFLALVCTANTVAKKLQTGTPPLQSDAVGDQPSADMNPEAKNNSEMMAGLEEEQRRQRSLLALDFHKSEDHTLASGGNSPMLSNNFDLVTSASVQDTSVFMRSRSFHTVEEYDALVSASHRVQSEAGVDVGAHLEENNFNNGDNTLHLRSRSFHTLGGYDTNQWSEGGGDARVGGMMMGMVSPHLEVSKSSSCKSTLQSEHLGRVNDDSTTKDQDIPIVVHQISTNSSEFNNSKLKNMDIPNGPPGSWCAVDTVGIDGDIAKKVNFTVEKGFRRKAKSKELTTLNIPTTAIEFPAIGSLGEWLELGGQVSFSGDYTTPRFGNFNVPVSENGNTGHAFFDPEMVAAFEEAMKELTVEEECILKQIEEEVDEEGRIVRRENPKPYIQEK